MTKVRFQNLSIHLTSVKGLKNDEQSGMWIMTVLSRKHPTTAALRITLHCELDIYSESASDF